MSIVSSSNSNSNMLCVMSTLLLLTLWTSSFVPKCLAAPTFDQRSAAANSISTNNLIFRRLGGNPPPADDPNDLSDVPSYMIWLSLLGNQLQQSQATPNAHKAVAAAAHNLAAGGGGGGNAPTFIVVDEDDQAALRAAVAAATVPIGPVMRRDVRQSKSSAWDVPRGANNAIFPHIGRRSDAQSSAMSMLLAEMAEARKQQQAGGSYAPSNMMIMPRIG